MFLYNWTSNGPLSVDLQKYHSQYVGMFMMSAYKVRKNAKENFHTATTLVYSLQRKYLRKSCIFLKLFIIIYIRNLY
jgi:hypothetical protein